MRDYVGCFVVDGQGGRGLRNNPCFAPGYINYLPINGAVIAPQFGDAVADKYSKDLLTRLCSGRAIV
ncbi:agmatine deiminase family protein [Pseudomonas sp. NPDC077649]|uniref:agmatine deiminase family protein n=1 Tax=Pseudomonas sp. NPDC077649 TaxID=3364423 RepID=UPI0037CC8236